MDPSNQHDTPYFCTKCIDGSYRSPQTCCNVYHDLFQRGTVYTIPQVQATAILENTERDAYRLLTWVTFRIGSICRFVDTSSDRFPYLQME